MHEDLKRRAMEEAIRSAGDVAAKTASSPANAAVQVICAALIAHRQLEMAGKASGASAASGAVADALMSSAGLSLPAPEELSVMQSLGLSPLVQFRHAKNQSAPPARGWFRLWFWRTAT
ncbi:hypothetical protein ACF8PL_18940 [Delftia sp. WSY_4]|uniref:hypothetical protein n=1 Tax=unclassified Delftia TaxID=2613839 RepID=UPI00370A8035